MNCDPSSDSIDVDKEYSKMLKGSWSGVNNKRLSAEDVLSLTAVSENSDFVYAFQTKRSAKMWGEDRVAYVLNIPIGAHVIKCYRTYNLGLTDMEYGSGAVVHTDNLELLKINNSMIEITKGAMYKTRLLKTEDGKIIGIYFKEV